MTKQQLIYACLAQLVSCYRSDAHNFREFYFKDWAAKTFTHTANNKNEEYLHPQFRLSNHPQELRFLNLHLIGSEFAKIDPGYLESAIDAVDLSASHLHF
jgi:monoamine oxidase